MANIVITGISIRPNPVEVGKQYIVSVEIRDKIRGIMTADGKAIMTSDNLVISKTGPEPGCLTTHDGIAIVTNDNKYIKTW